MRSKPQLHQYDTSITKKYSELAGRQALRLKLHALMTINVMVKVLF